MMWLQRNRLRVKELIAGSDRRSVYIFGGDLRTFENPPSSIPSKSHAISCFVDDAVMGCGTTRFELQMRSQISRARFRSKGISINAAWPAFAKAYLTHLLLHAETIQLCLVVASQGGTYLAISIALFYGLRSWTTETMLYNHKPESEVHSSTENLTPLLRDFYARRGDAQLWRGRSAAHCSSCRHLKRYAMQS